MQSATNCWYGEEVHAEKGIEVFFPLDMMIMLIYKRERIKYLQK